MSLLTKSFFAGATLPHPMAMQASVTLPQSIITVGGRDGLWDQIPDLYEISCLHSKELNRCHVNKLEQELHYPRAKMVAVLVPDEFTVC